MPLGPLGVISITFQRLALQSSLSHIQILFIKNRNDISNICSAWMLGRALLGADCDYSPNLLNGTLQHKVVFVITFLIVESSAEQPF